MNQPAQQERRQEVPLVVSNAVVVTGFVKIPGHPRTDEEYDRLGARLRELHSAPVRVFRDVLEDCWLHKHVHDRPVDHAVGDNPKKNSLAYHVVQHQKTAWLVSALETNPSADVLVWLDYGVFHQPGVTVDVVDAFLRRVRAREEISIPGCFTPTATSSIDWPDWRFCGSSLVVPRDLVISFHEAVRAVTLERLAKTGRVTWEVNDWAEVERRKMVPIRWYKADHNATQFTNYEAGKAEEQIMSDVTTQSEVRGDETPPELLAAPPQYRVFRPAFSPGSCYLLRDAAEEAYFARNGGAPEARLIDWATQFISHDETFLDVGAHVGSWAQHFALKCKQVHAFEPQRTTYERLLEGVQRAKLRNVTCHDVALGGQGDVDLHVVSVDGGGSTLRHRQELGAVLGVERVRCAQIDDFEFENVGLIKIDAEGFEIDILRGAANTLEKHRPTLLLEAWDHEWYARERAELIAHVVDLGYGIVSIAGWPQMMLVEPKVKRRSASRPAAESETPSQVLAEDTAAVKVDEKPAPPIPAQASELIRALQATAGLSPDRPLLGLAMIVKNEAKRIQSVLASYRPFIDAWTILDTGSTDGTQDLIRRELDGIPGTLHEEPFVDFATSRNRALELHGTTTVFSIMPNGDVLEGGGALVSFLDAHRRDFAGAYRVRIAPGHYFHPLVMRTGFGWRYKWRTHECAMGPNTGPAIPDVTVFRDRGTRTDDEWRARWMRDLDLLNRDRIDDPNDPRPYFYLGQTHECLGQPAQALDMYEKRAKMGGYFDEVYEAKFRIAKMKERLGHPWPEIQQAYLEAYAHDPRRAEPLYAISEYWYGKEIHSVSRLFSVTAARMPKPPTDLFLDEDVYTWKAADRGSISSFYTGHKATARDLAEQAVSFLPGDERLRANRAFCAPSMQELFGATAQAIDFTLEPGWYASNPSIYFDGERLRCIVRTVNYKIVNGGYVTPPEDVVRDEGSWKGWRIIRTRNFLLDLDPALGTMSVVEMVDQTGDERTAYPIHGFEDARLFAWKGAWWATATVCDFTEDGQREIALLQIREDGAVVRAEALRGPWSVHAQKNWMPLVDGDAVKFVYATSLDGDVGSTMIFDLVEADDAEARPRYSVRPPADASFDHGRLRGGSQAVRVDSGWLYCVHDVAFPGSGRMYLHRFVLLDDQLQLVSMTDPFYFEKLGIEFCAGLALVDGKLVASYSVNDGSARFGVFDWQAVQGKLRKDFVI